MKKLISALVMLAACQSSSLPPATTPQPRQASMPASAAGVTDARGAVVAFLGAVRDQDLQRISSVWGTKDGSVRDTGMPREELERRELVMLCYLRHQTAKVVSDAPAPDSHRVIVVELSRAGLTRSTNFYVVQGPGSRWYVENVDIEPLQDFVRQDRCKR